MSAGQRDENAPNAGHRTGQMALLYVVGADGLNMDIISPNLYLIQDTCQVYLLRRGDEAVLVDFGDGAVLDYLPQLGVSRISAVMFTHHHRDQAQGLARALRSGMDCFSGTQILAPQAEQDLFHSAGEHWQSRPILNNYDVRQDRFSILEPLSLTGVLEDYHTYTWGGLDWQVIPTPGHTPGSVSLLVTHNGERLAFTGDLIAGPGKVWSMAALQWSYHGMQGAAASIPALLGLLRYAPDRLLPSHGAVMDDAPGAIHLLVSRLRELLDQRGENLAMPSWLREPFQAVTLHLLRNRTSVANSYVLLSQSGKALIIDYGYDFMTGSPSGPDRAMHRPWLYSLDYLKQQYGVTAVEVVVATHYHDDHVAGMNLLRSVEGAQVWAAETFANVLEQPRRYNLPCLWYDPIPVDRVLPLEQAVNWQEYTLTCYALPGHTRYAAALAFRVDDTDVLATGDQYQGHQGLGWNYIYQNQYQLDDYQASADLYARLRPDLILPGHWDPLWTSAEYFDRLREQAGRHARLQRDLLASDSLDPAGDGFAARIEPYYARRPAGHPIGYQVEVFNPLDQAAGVEIIPVLPPGWLASPAEVTVWLQAGATGRVRLNISPPPAQIGRRFRWAVDIRVGEKHLGQQAEALIDLV